jgi:hypothetical protein
MTVVRDSSGKMLDFGAYMTHAINASVSYIYFRNETGFAVIRRPEHKKKSTAFWRLAETVK